MRAGPLRWRVVLPGIMASLLYPVYLPLILR